MGMTVGKAVWNQIQSNDHRLMRRVHRWRAPRWFRILMILMTRMGDGWLWYSVGLILLVYGCAYREEAVFAAVDEQDEADGIPEPAVAHPRHQNHQNAKPARRAPAVHAAHQAVVVRLNLVPDSFADCHTHSSAADCGTDIQRGCLRVSGMPRISAAQRRPKARSS